jgi:hypothetical protein
VESGIQSEQSNAEQMQTEGSDWQMTSVGDVITELMHEWLNVCLIKNVVGIHCNDILLMSIQWVTREIRK